MRFPLRLNVDLAWNRFVRVFKGGSTIISHCSPAVLAASKETDQEADVRESDFAVRTAADILSRTAAPVFWIGRGEPLEHPAIGRIVLELNRAKRTTFLHTNGARLRQRIHEFHPDSRLYLTVELTGREVAHDAACAQVGAYRRIIEGVRAAKLSGFHVCAHVTVNENTDVCEAGELFEDLDRYDIDGFIVSSGGVAPSAASAAAAAENLSETRALIRSGPWENFSRLLEASYAEPGEKAVSTVSGGSAGASSSAEAVEESA